MTKEAVAVIPLWALIFTAFGFIIGWGLGEEISRRRAAEEQVDELRERLAAADPAIPSQDRQLKEIRSVLNDVHRLIHAVSKGLEKRPC
jgi:hypothetical protein